MRSSPPESPGRTRPLPGPEGCPSVGRDVVVPLPEPAEGRQKPALRRCSSSEMSMSGVTSTSVPGVKSTISPGTYSRSRASGTLAVFSALTVSSPMATMSLGLTMVSSRRRCSRHLASGCASRTSPHLMTLVPYSCSGSILRRWQLFMSAVPARPKKATPSCSSDGRAWYLSRKMSAMGWPEPITGIVRAWLHREHLRISRSAR